MRRIRGIAMAALACALLVAGPATAAAQARQDSLDARVRAFLQGSRSRWRDMNVPSEDGQVLHDLIVQRRFTRVLEVGTSTGHSAIWMAWALAATGGRLVTIEIDEGRHRQALTNFREAGVAEFIDARRADAHELVPALSGPFDLAFLDADKDWNLRYFQAILLKLAPGGCIATHNISRRRWGRGGGEGGDYLAAVERTPGVTTGLVGTSIALSCRN
jgi:predicted O-methyltransferase YrrM